LKHADLAESVKNIDGLIVFVDNVSFLDYYDWSTSEIQICEVRFVSDSIDSERNDWLDVSSTLRQDDSQSVIFDEERGSVDGISDVEDQL